MSALHVRSTGVQQWMPLGRQELPRIPLDPRPAVYQVVDDADGPPTCWRRPDAGRSRKAKESPS